MYIIHTHQDKSNKHTIMLLLLPGLVFTLIISVYMIIRIQNGESLQVTKDNTHFSTDTAF